MNTHHEILEITQKGINQSLSRLQEEFKSVSDTILLRKPAPKSWSAAECFVHLIKTNRHYLREMRKELNLASRDPRPNATYKHGFIGGKLLSGVGPGKDGDQPSWKGSAPKSIKPQSSDPEINPQEVIDSLIKQYTLLLELIEQARELNLEKVRVKSLLGNIVRLKLGDAFRLLDLHTIRHLDQAKRAIA
ncbi:MAG: DinB family protein [Bacteroidota bacterium]